MTQDLVITRSMSLLRLSLQLLPFRLMDHILDIWSGPPEPLTLLSATTPSAFTQI